MRKFCIACLLVVLVAFAYPQQKTDPQPAAPQPAAPPAPKVQAVVPPADLQEIVRKQFGPNFKVALQRHAVTHYLHEPERAEWNSLMTGDLDGDGVEDAVIVARAKNAFAGQIPFDYKVIDPYFSAFGYGNPMITGGLGEEYPDGNYMVLVIHGSGPEGWRNPKPKAKYVMINLPFNTINVATINIETKKNKPRKEETAIILEEDGSSQSSMVVWTGRGYKWKDMGGPGE